MSKQQVRKSLAFTYAILMVGAPGIDRAQVSGQPEENSDEVATIVVTAQRRVENVQNVGISVTALSGDQLTQFGMTDTTDIVRQVPGVQFQQYSPSITVFNIRGVSQNDFSDHQESPVATYVDGNYVAPMGALAGTMYDLERVEVLRGPQGTLFGRNATGGLIDFITKRPTLKEDGYVNLSVGEYGLVNSEGAWNRPLADNIAARVSFATEEHRGLIENRLGPDTENQKQYSGRLQVLMNATDNLDLLLKLDVVRNPGVSSPNYSWRAAAPDPVTGLGTPVAADANPWGTCNGCDLGGYRNPSTDVFNQAFDQVGRFDRTVYGSTFQADLRLGFADLTMVTNFLHLAKSYTEDSDMSPNHLMEYDVNQTFHQVSQEFRLTGHADKLRWTGGIYLLGMETKDLAIAEFGSALGFLGTTGSAFTLKTYTYAGYGQVEWDFTDKLTAIVGARWTHDKKIDDFHLFAPYASAPNASTEVFTFNPSTDPGLADQNFGMFSGKLELDYRPADNFLTYASVNRGAKGGGFVTPVIPPIGDPSNLSFKPERLTTYEIGEKKTFLDQRVRINADVFYYDYQNYQAFELVNNGLTQVVKNLHARIKGAELEIAVVPVHGLDVNLGVSALDTRVKNVVLPFGEVVDRAMPQAPKWSLTASARYHWEMEKGTWYVVADSKTDAPFYFETFNAPVDYEAGHTSANVRLGRTSLDGRLDLSIFCNNLTDRRYRVFSVDTSGTGWNDQVYAPPRWIGATVMYRWQ